MFNQDYAEAYAISNGGQVVGTARTEVQCVPDKIKITNSFVLRPAVMTDLATPYPGDALTNLYTFGDLCVAHDSAAIGISNVNHVVGWADTTGGVIHAFLVRPENGLFFVDAQPDGVNDLMVDLGTLGDSDPVSSATAVNDNGQVTGYSYTLNNDGTAGYHAFIITPNDTNADGIGDEWYVGVAGKNNLMTDLDTLGGTNSWGRDINSDGVVVGESDYTAATGEHYTRAFRWTAGVMTDLESLRDDPDTGFSAASGINDDGTIVGWAENEQRIRHAFVYEDGKMQDLNDLLYLKNTDGTTTSPTIVLSEARSINADGLIAGWGVVKGTQSTTLGFLLIPVMVDPADLVDDDTNGSNNNGGSNNGSNASSTPDFSDPTATNSGTSNSTSDTGTTQSQPLAPFCAVSTSWMLIPSLVGLSWLKLRRRH
jgi:probable HAF family extracellular repeat protein